MAKSEFWWLDYRDEDTKMLDSLVDLTNKLGRFPTEKEASAVAQIAYSEGRPNFEALLRDVARRMGRYEEWKVRHQAAEQADKQRQARLRAEAAERERKKQEILRQWSERQAERKRQREREEAMDPQIREIREDFARYEPPPKRAKEPTSKPPRQESPVEGVKLELDVNQYQEQIQLQNQNLPVAGLMVTGVDLSEVKVKMRYGGKVSKFSDQQVYEMIREMILYYNGLPTTQQVNQYAREHEGRVLSYPTLLKRAGPMSGWLDLLQQKVIEGVIEAFELPVKAESGDGLVGAQGATVVAQSEAAAPVAGNQGDQGAQSGQTPEVIEVQLSGHADLKLMLQGREMLVRLQLGNAEPAQ